MPQDKKRASPEIETPLSFQQNQNTEDATVTKRSTNPSRNRFLFLSRKFFPGNGEPFVGLPPWVFLSVRFILVFIILASVWLVYDYFRIGLGETLVMKTAMCYGLMSVSLSCLIGDKGSQDGSLVLEGLSITILFALFFTLLNVFVCKDVNVFWMNASFFLITFIANALLLTSADCKIS